MSSSIGVMRAVMRRTLASASARAIATLATSRHAQLRAASALVPTLRRSAITAIRSPFAKATGAMRSMFIQTEPTPNPQSIKFLPGEVVLDDRFSTGVVRSAWGVGGDLEERARATEPMTRVTRPHNTGLYAWVGRSAPLAARQEALPDRRHHARVLWQRLCLGHQRRRHELGCAFPGDLRLARETRERQETGDWRWALTMPCTAVTGTESRDLCDDHGLLRHWRRCDDGRAHRDGKSVVTGRGGSKSG